MKEIKQNFKEIMFIELRDLRQDLELLIEESRRRSSEHAITDRVFQENTALFKNELLGLEEFSKILEKTNAAHYADLNEMMKDLGNQFTEKIRSADLAEAIIVCVERKMKKVANYVLPVTL